MKKIHIILVGIIIMISSEVSAQKVITGIRGGVNLSTIKFSSNGVSFTPDRAPKIHLGFFFNQELSEHFVISPEVLYYGVGYKPESGSLVNNLTLHYLAIPVLIKYYPTAAFNLHAGPQIGILAGGTEVNGQSITKGTKNTEVAFGLGAEGLLSDNFGIGARYIFGLTNTDDTPLDLDQKSNIIQFSLFVLFQ